MKFFAGFVVGMATVFATIRALESLVSLDGRWEFNLDELELGEQDADE